MSAATYRSATFSDVDHIVDFQLAMALETEQLELVRSICADGVRAVFEGNSRGQYYIAELEGLVVGSLLITYEWSDWRNGVVWWIQSVYVVPGARKKGVYSGLYSHVQRLAENDSKVRGIRLYVDNHNRSAQEVYTRLGMNGNHYTVFEWMKGAES
jgi:GNAT superfamily N-acetyltransferase